MTPGLFLLLAVGAVKFIGVHPFRRYVSSGPVGTTIPLLHRDEFVTVLALRHGALISLRDDGTTLPPLRLDEFVAVLALRHGALSDLYVVGTTLPPLRLDQLVTVLALRLGILTGLRFLLVCGLLTRSRRPCFIKRRMIFPGARHHHRPLLRIIRLF